MIVEDPLLLRIPADFTTAAIGDVRQVTGARSSMAHFDIGYRKSARLHAVDKIAHVRHMLIAGHFFGTRAGQGLSAFGDYLVTGRIHRQRAVHAVKSDSRRSAVELIAVDGAILVDTDEFRVLEGDLQQVGALA